MEQYKCPHCGSTNVRTYKDGMTPLVIAGIFFTCISMGLAAPVAFIIYLLLPEHKQCRDCSLSF